MEQNPVGECTIQEQLCSYLKMIPLRDDGTHNAEYNTVTIQREQR
jgi:hypothetical protein